MAVRIAQNDGLCLAVVSIDTTKHICRGCTVPTRSCVEHEQVVLWTAVKRLPWDHCDTRLSRKNERNKHKHEQMASVLMFSQYDIYIRYGLAVRTHHYFSRFRLVSLDIG